MLIWRETSVKHLVSDARVPSNNSWTKDFFFSGASVAVVGVSWGREKDWLNMLWTWFAEKSDVQKNPQTNGCSERGKSNSRLAGSGSKKWEKSIKCHESAQKKRKGSWNQFSRSSLMRLMSEVFLWSWLLVGSRCGPHEQTTVWFLSHSQLAEPNTSDFWKPSYFWFSIHFESMFLWFEKSVLMFLTKVRKASPMVGLKRWGSVWAQLQSANWKEKLGYQDVPGIILIDGVGMTSLWKAYPLPF